MVTIVDYGMGNLRSVAKAFERLGVKARVTQKPEEVTSAEKLVLPGVGAFEDAVRNLKELRLTESLLAFLDEGRPFLGICLGLQLLFAESEEGGLHKGFGRFPGRVKRFPEDSLKVPHIGWNRVNRTGRAECPLLKGVPDGSYFYFVHSYYAEPADQTVTAAKTDYGIPFTSVLWRENVYATQFHPEKSQALGLKVLENFARV